MEEHFYLIYPMLYLFLRRYLPSAKRQAAVLLGICAAVLAWRFVMVLGLHASVSRVYIGTDTRIDGILFGCVLGVVGNPMLDLKKPGEESRLSRLWAPILAPVGILAIILFYVGTDSPAPSFLQPVAISQTVQYTVEGLALIPLFVVAIRHYNWGIFKLLNTRTAKLVGAMSYSIYIVHELVIVWVHRHLGGGRILHGPIYLIITVIIGFVMLRFIERPCARLRKRLSRAQAKDGTYAPRLSARRRRQPEPPSPRALTGSRGGNGRCPGAEYPTRMNHTTGDDCVRTEPGSVRPGLCCAQMTRDKRLVTGLFSTAGVRPRLASRLLHSDDPWTGPARGPVRSGPHKPLEVPFFWKLPVAGTLDRRHAPPGMSATDPVEEESPSADVIWVRA